MTAILILKKYWREILIGILALLLILAFDTIKAELAQKKIDNQNIAALTDSTRQLKNGMAAHLALIAKDSADLARMGKSEMELSTILEGLKAEKAHPIAAVIESVWVSPPVTPAIAPVVTPAGIKTYHDSDICTGASYHWSATAVNDTLKNVWKQFDLDLSTLLVTRKDGKREFRSGDLCPWVHVTGLNGVVFEGAALVGTPHRINWTVEILKAALFTGAGVWVGTKLK